MTNLQLFLECLIHDENLMDSNSYYSNILLSSDDLNKIEAYRGISQGIKDKITAIKELLNLNNTNNQINELVDQIIEKLSENGAQYNEFACFLHACDISLDTIKEIKSSDSEKSRLLLKWVIQQYIGNRTMLDSASLEWTKALYDDSASRRKGKAGEKKLADILIGQGFSLCEDWEQFIGNNKVFFVFSTGKGKFTAAKIRKKLNIKYQFNKDHDKSSDICVKYNNRYYIIEAKHLKEGGGSQDKQFQELLDLIKYTENNVSYVSFLDGAYRNFLLKSDSIYKNTSLTRIEKIKELLKSHKKNYFVNTFGFKKLFTENNNLNSNNS